MKFGIGSFSYPLGVSSGRITHEGLLDLGIEQGAEVVQYCENLSLLDLVKDSLLELVARASGAGIQLEVGTRGLNSDNLIRHAELAAMLGSSFVRLVIHGNDDAIQVEAATEKLAGILDDCLGVQIAIENHDHLPFRELRKIMETLGPARVGITLDTANSFGCLEGTNEVVESLATYTLCLHVKDVVASRLPSMLGFLIVGTTAGQGGVDIPLTISRMTPKCRSVILEQWPYSDSSIPPYHREIESAEMGFRYLRSLKPPVVDQHLLPR